MILTPAPSPLRADDQYSGGSTRTVGQFLAKWLELLRPTMNDEDRKEFIGDLEDALRRER